MRAFRLTRSKTPLSTASVLELFQKIDAKLPFINYEPVADLVPSSGELFIIEGLDTPVADGQIYATPSDIFHEEKFDVVIDRTKTSPKLFRFIYYNRTSWYRVAHYLICEQKTGKSAPAPQNNTVADRVCSNFLEEYAFLQDILFRPEKAQNTNGHLDLAFWKELVNRHIEDIVDSK
ncbi:hypothetical protein NEMIN01_1631 [Nematocida minor]|uniref:uncharacterized protein n=1 Tax=Nematocida minor TaxID=1912983 RepID=UPI0022206926|nr:uncharacterized protein NEMIN01_1631 [Nematocida minor]KAI5191698.1 hypothetical protein NEMIN01_1631 [Nematocida minor]